MVVFSIGTYAVNSIILGWVSSTCGETKEKKASSLAIVNTIANVSFIWTPYLWPDSDAPRYTIAMSSSGKSKRVRLTCVGSGLIVDSSCLLHCHCDRCLGDALLAQEAEQEDPAGLGRDDLGLCLLEWTLRQGFV